MVRTFAPLVIAVALAVGGAGCKQGIGDRCEQNSDCSSGLCSQQGVATTANMSGVCLPSNSTTGVGGSGGLGVGGSGGGGAAGSDGAATDAQDAAGDLAPATDATSDALTDTAPSDTATD